MTTRLQAQCATCARYRSPFSSENTTGLAGPFCAAFPDSIPQQIWTNRADHRQPFENDHGLRWESSGESFPEWAMAPGAVLLTAASRPLSGATVDRMTGAMVALVPSAPDVARLAVDGGEPAGDLHCTLLFLGDDASLIDQASRDEILGWAREAAANWGANVEASGFAISMFNPNGEEPCVVLGCSGTELADFGVTVQAEVGEIIDLPEQHQPWIPHVTLAYTPDPAMVGTLTDRCGPISFDRLRMAFGGEVTDIPLGELVPAPEHWLTAANASHKIHLEINDAMARAIPGGFDESDAPTSAEMADAVREVWNGCPYCLAPLHAGACDLSV